MMKTIRTILLLLTLPCYAAGQEAIHNLTILEDSLTWRFERIRDTGSDSMKLVHNEKVLAFMHTIMEDENAFDYPFSKTSYMGKIYSDDREVRLITWNVALDNGTHRYFGFLMRRKNKRDKHDYWELTDKSAEIEEPDKELLGADDWYGALYYRIITNETRTETYYTLLGWDGNDLFTTKKIIDALYFNWLGTPKFGPDIFRHEQYKRRRVLFEYGEQVNMTLEYRDDMRMIVFDHLAPSEPAHAGQYRFYGPDMSFDAFEFYDGHWNYLADIDVKMSKKEMEERESEAERKEKERMHQLDRIYSPYETQEDIPIPDGSPPER